MCVIAIGNGINKKTKKHLESTLSDMAVANADGFSLISDINDYKVIKSIDSLDILEHLDLILKSNLFIAHFRLATHGLINIDNCHGFDIGLERLLFHNGIISGLGTDILSDTAELAAILYNTRTSSVIRMLECLNASGNGKFIVMDKATKIYYTVGTFEKDRCLSVSNKN